MPNISKTSDKFLKRIFWSCMSSSSLDMQKNYRTTFRKFSNQFVENAEKPLNLHLLYFSKSNSIQMAAKSQHEL